MLDIDEAVAVTTTGELDMVNAPALSARLRDQLDRRPRGLILELDLGFCGSAGLQVIAQAVTRTFELDVPFAVATASAPVLRALEIGHLTEVVTVTGTVAQTRTWIRAQPGRRKSQVVSGQHRGVLADQGGGGDRRRIHRGRCGPT